MTRVHPSAIVDKTVELADDVVIGPGCIVGEGVVIGGGTVLDANVVIGPNVKIGKGNKFFPFSVVGTRPQILTMNADDPVGGLIIGDNNVFREQATVHPSMHSGGSTKIGDENFLMIGVHVGHDCALEDKLVLSNYVQISGHCRIETGVWLSGMVLLHQFVTVGKWCYAAGMAGLNHDVTPFTIVSGHYPPQVRGVNKRGLARAGLTEKQQESIVEAYKRLYRNGQPLLETATAMAAEQDHDENVRAMVDSIINSSKHRFGRYLETFRH
jgi:UDP-N-acetylglucosamine acyltransferase